MRDLISRAAVVASATAALLILAAGVASASAAQFRAPSLKSSRFFAGYQARVTAGSATSSEARFKVPKLSCSSAQRAITPDAGVAANRGTTVSAAFLFVGCRNGMARYFPGLVINGHEVDYTSTHFSAGDLIEVFAKVTRSRTRVRITDVTSGVTKKRAGPGARSSAALIGDGAWVTKAGTLFGVPNFGKLTFTHCEVDGSALAHSHPARYRRVNRSGAVQIATGALSANGTAFATIYKHS
jgi:peptidase A4-like protein